MKKGKIFKHLFATFVMVASFFMFSKASVQAVEINIEGSNFSFVLEEKVVGEPENGYIIVDVYDACEGIDNCSSLSELEHLVIPSEYNGYPIVEIADGSTYIDGDNKKAYDTALVKLASVQIEKVTVGSKINYLGDFAFSSLNVNEVYLSSSVTSLGKYIFDGSEVVDVYVSRYLPGNEFVFTNSQAETFSSLVGEGNLKHIIFDNGTVRSEYLGYEGTNYDLVEDKLTYKVFYEFYDEGIKKGERIYYFGETVNEMVSLVSRNGFEFLGWGYTETNETVDFVLGVSSPKGNGGTVVNKVYSKWQLKKPMLKIETYVGGNLDDDHKIEYVGDDTRIDIVATENMDISGYSVKYQWYRRLSSGGQKVPFENDDNTHSIFSVAESGTYFCQVLVSYGVEPYVYNSYEEISLFVEVIKRDLKIKINDEEVIYGEYVNSENVQMVVNSLTPLLEGHMIKAIYSPGYEHKVSAGVYGNVLEAEIVDICKKNGETCDSNDTTNYLSNYNVILEEEDKGTLTVHKKDMSVKLLIPSNRIVYGENEILTATKNVSAYGDEVQLKLTYTRENPLVKDAGVYLIDGVSLDEVNAKNYNVSLESNEYKFYIDQREVEVKWNPEDYNYVYNGSKQPISASYDALGVETELDLLIVKDNQETDFINAGTYVIDVDLDNVDENYTLTNTRKTIIIHKANSEFYGQREVVYDYDGKVHNVEVELNHTEKEIKKDFVSVECKNATIGGTPCRVKVSVAESDNYYGKSELFNIYIKQRILYIEPKLFEITYGTPNITSLLKETVDSDISGETVDVNYFIEYVSGDRPVGVYDIETVEAASYPSNYIVKLFPESGNNKVKIVPAPVEVVFFLFSDNLVYNGRVQNVEVRVDGADANVVGLVGAYDDNKTPVNAGDYRYSVSITNKNYYISGTSSIEFSIAKANYDISNLKLKDKNVKFDFKGHSIELEGDLPKGLSYTYEIDGVKGGNGTSLPFSHTVKVYFEGDFENYNILEPLVATLYVDMTWVWIALILMVLGVGIIITGVILLIKFNMIRFTKRVKRRAFVKIMRKNRIINDINALISSTRKELEKEETLEIIEENVKFIKTDPIKVNKEIISMSFVDELFKADKVIKEYYSEIKNELLSYEGVSSKIKRDYETFYLHNLPIARLDIEKGILYAFYALDPTVYKVEEYKHENVSKKKEFSVVPLKLKVNSLQSLRHAKMFVRIIRKKENIKSVSNFVRMDYARVYSVKEGAFKIFKKARDKRKKKDGKWEHTED